MAGSWDFCQELNFATSGGGNPALCRCKAEEAVKMKRKSAAGIAKGSTQNHRLVEAGRDLWRSSGPSPLLQQGCLEPVARDYVVLCHTMKRYSMLYHTMLCCRNHTFSFVLSFFFRASHDTKVLSSGFSEEERKMSGFLNRITTRSSRGTSSLFYRGKKNQTKPLRLDVLWLRHLITSRRAFFSELSAGGRLQLCWRICCVALECHLPSPPDPTAVMLCPSSLSTLGVGVAV